MMVMYVFGAWPVMVICVLRGVACDGDMCVGGCGL